MKTLRIAIAALTVLCFSPLAHAQDDPKRTAAAAEMLDAMHADQLITKIMEAQKENITKMIGTRLPKNLPPDTQKKVDDAVSSSVDALFKTLTWESLKADFIRINAEAYTEQELKDQTAFYKTPSGQKMVEKLPDIQTKTAAIIHDRIMAAMPQLQTTIRDAIQASVAAPSNPAPAPKQ